MIIEKEIEIKIFVKNIEHYISKGYKIKLYDTIKIKNSDLTPGSHIFVDCKCDYCGDIHSVMFKRYYKATNIIKKYSCNKIGCSNKKIIDVCNIKYGVDNPFQNKDVKDKIKETLMNKYGVEHPMYLEETKEKIRNTCIEKYGVKSAMQSPETREKVEKTCMKRYGVKSFLCLKSMHDEQKQKRIDKGEILSDDKIKPFILYRRNVDNLTDINKKELFEKWNGYDYYDNEYIKDNKYSDFKNYPSIDHKISVIYGFLNNISIEEIADNKNLCITKVSNNCKKWYRCEKDQ